MVHFDEALGALAAEIAIHAALDDAEEGLGRLIPRSQRRDLGHPIIFVIPRSPNARDLGHPIFLNGVKPGDFVLMSAEVDERALSPGHGEAEALFGASALGGVLGALIKG